MSNFLRILCAKIIEIGPLLTELLNHCVEQAEQKLLNIASGFRYQFNFIDLYAQIN